MKKDKPTLYASDDNLLEAIQFAWENKIWPSSKNLAILMGYKILKLNGRMNKRRIIILRGYFNM